MKLASATLGVGLIALAWACAGELSSVDDPPVADAGAGDPDAEDPAAFDELDTARARARFVTTTDLMRYVFAPGCAAETNECHSNEDFPDLHTEGNLWNLVGLGCNKGVGDRTTVEDFCESQGDQLRITSGANTGFTATIGSIDLVTDDAGEFVAYQVMLEGAVAQADTGASFEILRGGAPVASLGGGSSLDAGAGANLVSITDAGDVTDVALIRQGDENGNGVFGDGSGALVEAGDARRSYLVRRLLAAETSRVRMPLSENVDNPNEVNRSLSRDEMYAIMSWINCMEPGDGVYSPIRYDCAANAGNEGKW